MRGGVFRGAYLRSARSSERLRAPEVLKGCESKRTFRSSERLRDPERGGTPELRTAAREPSAPGVWFELRTVAKPELRTESSEVCTAARPELRTAAREPSAPGVWPELRTVAKPELRTEPSEVCTAARSELRTAAREPSAPGVWPWAEAQPHA